MFPLWTLILLILMFLTLAIRPRLMWELTKWEYKNPEANEPSETAFQVNRGMGIIGLLIVVPMAIGSIASLVAEANQQQQIDEQRSAAEAAEQEQELRRFREPHALTAENRLGYGQVVGYWRVPDSKELRVVWLVDDCATFVSASISESKKAVDVRIVEKTSRATPLSPCSAPRKQVSSKIFTLDERLGKREVRVPFDGDYMPIPECDPETVIASDC
ncbi:DUF6199 family natural product biosynthesis protein [Nonomuraea sp. NPDC046802]|uniref:DUF6199 family natural product biosynthesis protein n=1 Tax=Nonomuraea sp. NPDC046802 TaxID=3154919 RepID=UPI0033D24D41